MERFEDFDENGDDKSLSSKPSALILFNPGVDTTHDMPVQKERFGD